MCLPDVSLLTLSLQPSFVILLFETKETGTQSIGIPPPPLSSCVTLAKLPHLSVLSFPYVLI